MAFTPSEIKRQTLDLVHSNDRFMTEHSQNFLPMFYLLFAGVPVCLRSFSNCVLNEEIILFPRQNAKKENVTFSSELASHYMYSYLTPFEENIFFFHIWSGDF